MRVNIEFLQEGCILSEDVLSSSARLIMKNKTVMTSEMIEILKAFLIPEVSVEKHLINGKVFHPKEMINEFEGNSKKEENTFISNYLEAVQKYKQLFRGWQAGANVNVVEIRELFLPLLHKALINPKGIFELHHYSTKEEYFFHHSISVGLISGFLGEKLQLSHGEIVQLSLAGCLCDVGMSKLPISILEKRTSLTREEFEEVKNHPIDSSKMLQKSAVLKKEVIISILQHHERLDGTGYPLRETGERIHLYARVIAVADVFHAMTSERIYRTKHSPYKVFEMILHDDFGKYDIRVLKALETGVVSFQIGSLVRLSNSQIGKVIYYNTSNKTRPVLQLESQLVDLEKRRDLFIEEIVEY